MSIIVCTKFYTKYCHRFGLVCHILLVIIQLTKNNQTNIIHIYINTYTIKEVYSAITYQKTIIIVNTHTSHTQLQKYTLYFISIFCSLYLYSCGALFIKSETFAAIICHNVYYDKINTTLQYKICNTLILFLNIGLYKQTTKKYIFSGARHCSEKNYRYKNGNAPLQMKFLLTLKTSNE